MQTMNLRCSKSQFVQSGQVTLLRFHCRLLLFVHQRLEGTNQLEIESWRDVCVTTEIIEESVAQITYSIY